MSSFPWNLLPASALQFFTYRWVVRQVQVQRTDILPFLGRILILWPRPVICALSRRAYVPCSVVGAISVCPFVARVIQPGSYRTYQESPVGWTLYELTCKDVRLNYFMAFAEPPLPLS